MGRLLAAEFQKLFTTRLWLWLLLATMALTALWVSLTIGFSEDPGNTVTLPLTSVPGQRMVVALAASAAVPFVAVLGAVGMAGEFRHRTATMTFLATPHRGRVVAAKMVCYALLGAAYAVACLAVNLAITLPWLAARDTPVALTGGGMPGTLAGVVVAVALFAVIGIGVGALLREQAATVVGLLVYLFVVEPILTQVPALQSWTAYLPGAAKNALTQLRLSSDALLEPWQGAVVLLGYGVLLAFLGRWLAVRRDVT